MVSLVPNPPVLTPRMEILHPDEAIPLLLDPQRSPVVSLDTEFSTSDDAPTCRAPMNGLSMAGGTPETGFFGTFWPWVGGISIHPWAFVRDQVILPILRDPNRHMAMHPPKVEMQILHARGVTDDDVLCQLWCTFALTHMYDENLPKGLKELGNCLLGRHDLTTHAATQKEIAKIRKAGPKQVKAILKDCWLVYKEHRRKSKELEVAIDPAWESWKRLTMEMPPKLLKRDVMARIERRIAPTVMDYYERAAVERFARYGAEDALLTIALFYFIMQRIDLRFMPAVRLETQVCHPCVTEMEENGLRIDLDELTAMYNVMARVIEQLRADVIDRWGKDLPPAVDKATGQTLAREFNPASTDQVCQVLWDSWRLRPPPFCTRGGQLIPKWRRNKDGYCKVDADVLGWLEKNAPQPYRDHIAQLLKLRRYEKLLGTYVGPMLTRATLDPQQRIHASFWPVGARTGRFASSEPNVENIPRPYTMPEVPVPPGTSIEHPPRGVIVDEVKESGKLRRIWRIQSLRNVVIPATRWKLVSADLAQIENRIIAVESQDPGLLYLFRGWDCAACGQSGETEEPLHACPNCGSGEGARDKAQPDQPAQFKWRCPCGAKGTQAENPTACPKCGDIKLEVGGFCLGRDIHSRSAITTGLAETHGPKEGRQRAKAVNHAFNYGMGYRTLSQKENIPLREAKRALEAIDRAYPYVRARLHARVRKSVWEDGYVTFFDGLHTRRFPVARLLYRTGNFEKWEQGAIIREAVNSLAQGGTGVIMKMAMVNIRAKLLAHPNPLVRMTKLVNQVHDELLYEAREEVAEIVLKLVCWELEHAVRLGVPVIADGAVGDTWGAAH